MDYKKYISSVSNEKTIKTYDSVFMNHLKQFTNQAGIIAPKKTKSIIEYIENLNKSGSTKKAIYSLLINISLNDDLKKLWRTKQEDMNKIKLKEQKKRMNNKSETLPELDELQTYLKTLYKTEDYKAYVINFILLNYYTRNKDLMIKIINKKADVEPNKNYLILRKGDIVYLRQDYKTFNNYGKKQYIIKSKQLHKALTALTQENGFNFNLLDTEDDDNLTAEITKYTYKNLNESDYTKISVSSVDINKHPDDLLKIAERRGTETSMLLSTYKIR